MPAHSRSKNGVASLAYVAGIHVFILIKQDADGRNRFGHDELPSQHAAGAFADFRDDLGGERFDLGVGHGPLARL